MGETIRCPLCEEEQDARRTTCIVCGTELRPTGPNEGTTLVGASSSLERAPRGVTPTLSEASPEGQETSRATAVVPPASSEPWPGATTEDGGQSGVGGTGAVGARGEEKDGVQGGTVAGGMEGEIMATAADPLGDVSSEPGAGTRAPRRTVGEGDSAPGGLTLDWSPKLVRVVEEAAELEGVSVQKFIERLVLPAVKKVIETKRGLLSLSQAAERLGVTKKEVTQMLARGELRARKVDGEWRVEEASLREVEGTSGDLEAQIELDLQELVRSSALMGLETEGDYSPSLSSTICYVNQSGVLVFPRQAWRRLGRKLVMKEARDAVRRYLRRRDRDAGIL